jgi:GT2 family glycosyltransferase
LSLNESYPQHVVTAVIVAHDGATWLPHVADALAEQTRPVQRVVAVDTGSRDRSGAVLAAKFGQPAVFGMDRSTGYGAAVARALKHRAATVPVPSPGGGPAGDRVEWIWLLHDDSEPAPDALEQLLRGVAETNSAAVLGPKLRDWTNRDVIAEAGITLDTAARRVTGIEPREVDQGQHDGDRDTLAVSSAGMLVRRDVWDQVGGFDTGMGLFMEDIDFCWRVHAAGYRVRVITDAVVYHAQAATKHRRVVSVGRRSRMLDRRNGLLTLLGNLPFRQMLTAIAGNVVVSFLRISFFLLAKRLAAAMDEAAALGAVLLHPLRLVSMRSKRARGRRSAYSRIRADLPPGRSARRLAEFMASALAKSQADTTGSHHASADPTDDDSLLEDNGLARRLLTSPTLWTFIALLAVALLAARSLLTGGPLGGGSLVPAWGGASDLWRTYVQAFHPVGVGSTAAAPPWLAVIAGLSTVVAGKPWLAIDVILIGCVPLAGMTAMLAARRLTASAPVRVWASLTYALLPVATGVVAGGRFGSAVAFVLLPLIVLTAGRIFTSSRKQASRAAWATGLLVAVSAAFVPLLWPVAFVACLLAAIAFRATRPGLLRNLAVVALTAPVLLMPWTVTVASHPSDVLLEAGLPQPGTPVTGLPARALMLLSPGGPGLPSYWVTAGLIAVALAALFAGRRRRIIAAGWGLALSGLLTAIVVSHMTVRPADGAPVVVWAGLPLAVAALGLLLAAAVGADALGRLTGGRKGWTAILTGSGVWAGVLGVVAFSAPVLAAASWLSTGVGGPIHPVSSQLVPELVAAADGQGNQVRTLVLRESRGHVSYLLLRGPSPSIADSALTPPPAAQQALSRVVAALTTPDGGMAVNQARLLAQFDIGFVLVQAPVDQQLATVLNNVPGLRTYSTRPTKYVLWQLSAPPSRVSVLEPNGTVVPIASGPVGISAAKLPAAGGTLMLAEPASGWSATVNGHPLTQVPSPAGSWAQAFRLPGGGGTLEVSHSGLGHDLVLLLELIAFLGVFAMALPGMHVADAEGQRASDIEAGDAADSGPAGASPGSRAHELAGAGYARAAAGGRDADEDDDQLAGSGTGRGAGLAAAAATAGALRPSRGLRGSRGRSSHASRGRSGPRERGPQRDREGAGRSPERGSAGRGSRAGRAGAYGDDLAELDAQDAALPWGRGVDPDDRGGRDGGLADRDRLAGAWPYEAQDAPRGDPRAADSGPHSVDGDRMLPRRRERPGERADGAWPYPGDNGRSSGEHDGLAETGPGRWSRHDDAGAPGADRRRPARSASGSWPSPEAGGGYEPESRASSPSGSWPYPADDGRAGNGQPDRLGDSGRFSTPARSDASMHADPPVREGRGRYDGPSRYDRPERYDGQGQYDGPGRYDGPAQYDSPGRYDGPARYESQDRYAAPRADDSLPRRRPEQANRWGRPDYGERPAPPAGSQPAGRRGAEPAAWPGGDDALEPLPPINGPSRGTSRRNAWSPGAGDQDWDGPDDYQGRQRWSESEPGYERGYEPDHEGDSW